MSAAAHKQALRIVESERVSFSKAVRHVVFGDSLTCRVCGASVGYKGLRHGLPIYCGNKCYAKDSKHVDTKRQITMLDRYGASYCAQSAAIRAKQTETCESRYGASSPLGNSSIRARCKETLLANYGVTNTFDSPAIRKKAKETVMERYRVEFTMQCPVIFEKQQYSSRKSSRDISFPGKTFKGVKGYEPEALEFLINSKRVKTVSIKYRSAEGLPNVPWVDKKGKSHVYHPDFLIGRKHLVEVKSTFTSGCRAARRFYFYRLKRKAQACIDAGYRFTLLIVFSPEERASPLEVKNVHELKRADLVALVDARVSSAKRARLC